jgi:hypothetical protein
MKSDATKALKQIQRVIQSLQERKLEIIQDEFAAPLTEIVSIAREHDLTLDLISYAMMQKTPRESKTVPRKNKRSSVTGAASSVMTS